MTRALGLDVMRREGKLDTVRLHLGYVTEFLGLTTNTLGADAANQVEVVADEPVKHHVEAVPQQTEVEAKVKLVLLLIGKVAVTQTAQVEGHLVDIVLLTPAQGGIIQCLGMTKGHGTTLGSKRVAQAQLGIGECTLLIQAHVLEEGLIADVPCTRHVPSGEPTVLTGATHLVRTLVADCSVKDVTSKEGIVEVGKISHIAAVILTDAVIGTILFLNLLEEFVVGVRQIAVSVNHAPSVKRLAETVQAHGFHTGEQGENVISIMEILHILA